MNGEIIPIIIGMGIVTYIPRWLPLFFLTRHRLSPSLIDWLGFIPAAILSALILPSLVTGGEPRHLVWVKPDLWVAAPTLVFALKTKSLAGTVVIGMVLYWLALNVFL
ncbi:MAG: AzlD domain-containing protein [Deltaproteobacteria bacterium]|nr:AzlD domain-containing protein [Deltaproteobacteria bacterium]